MKVGGSYSPRFALMQNCDVLIVGGGILGLSVAYELSQYGKSVHVLDQGPMAREASWAGAGIIPPANRRSATHPYDQLRGLSYELHSEWAERLRVETGIDTGFRRCGGLYLARSSGEAASLQALAMEHRELDVAFEELQSDELQSLEPALEQVVKTGELKAVYLMPGECQIRNPRHLQALILACQQRGVKISPNREVTEFEIVGNRLSQVHCDGEVFAAEQFCLTAGAWTYALLSRLGVSTGIMPVRGQIVLFRCQDRPFQRIINEGPRYLVARDDGHVLVGSTEEEVGFDKSTTEEAISALRQFAQSWVPCLTADKIAQSWAGLRPGSFDGMPYIGEVPGLSNTFAAAGHFRSGLYLSPGTAVTLGQRIRGVGCEIDLTPFQVGRG